jgi:hypothetical protein
MSFNAAFNRTRSALNAPLSRFILSAALAALTIAPAYAQAIGNSPFATPLNAFQTFALGAARVIGVIVLVFGFARVAMGGHRTEGIAEMLIGVGGMAYAQQLVNWLFP